MSSCFRFRPMQSRLAAADIASLRKLCDLSISEIQRRALNSESLLDVPVFQGDWPSSKAKVVAILQHIEAGALPLAIHYVEFLGTTSESEEHLSPSTALDRLQFLREISLEQDMLSQLEEGYISSPEEYEPPPEDEA
jgi:hypothetical protein